MTIIPTVSLRRCTINAIARIQSTEDSNYGDEFYLAIHYLKSEQIYRHCKFRHSSDPLPIVACRHFNYAFGEERPVRKQGSVNWKFYAAYIDIHSQFDLLVRFIDVFLLDEIFRFRFSTTSTEQTIFFWKTHSGLIDLFVKATRISWQNVTWTGLRIIQMCVMVTWLFSATTKPVNTNKCCDLCIHTRTLLL